jgi:hypothetical protein
VRSWNGFQRTQGNLAPVGGACNSQTVGLSLVAVYMERNGGGRKAEGAEEELQGSGDWMIGRLGDPD